MKVKISDTVYDVGNQPVMIFKTANDSKAQFVAEVKEGVTVSKALFPENWGTARQEMEWMNIESQAAEALP